MHGRLPVTVVLALTSSCALWACSSSSGPGGGTDGGGDGVAPVDDAGSPGDGGGKKADGGGGHEAGTDGGTPGDSGGGGSCAIPDAAGVPNEGVVSLSVLSAMKPPVFGVIGVFKAKSAASICHGTTMGACCYEPPPDDVYTPLAAGTITLDDGASTLATLMPPDYSASSATTATLTWKPGDTLKLSASGAAIDAFTASIVAPDLLAGMKPDFSAPLTVPLKKDYVVSWTPSSDTCSRVSFGLTQSTTGSDYIVCIVDDAAGTLSVPAALLGKFTAAGGTALMQRTTAATAGSANTAVAVNAIDELTTTTTYTP